MRGVERASVAQGEPGSVPGTTERKRTAYADIAPVQVSHPTVTSFSCGHPAQVQQWLAALPVYCPWNYGSLASLLPVELSVLIPMFHRTHADISLSCGEVQVLAREMPKKAKCQYSGDHAGSLHRALKSHHSRQSGGRVGQVDGVSFGDVGGLDHYIRALKEMVFLPLARPSTSVLLAPCFVFTRCAYQRDRAMIKEEGEVAVLVRKWA